ncbi:lysine-specific demethylase 5B-B-like [Pseudoliparis swirei]|uniref:lysine-specific demethylase 5B-B-like n=1 Tax=Pseudoliparis swirei TaxID=2059687 RepID=UPI0024BEC4BA|nr:lysine-specific demethylase 5B-B-like [Pseudoliparis swirei]
MRRNRLGKEDWVNIKWQPGQITHTCQKDGNSCGIFVMQMAKMTVMELPNIPQHFRINSSKQSMEKLRRNMAEDILKQSVSKDELCSFCGIEDHLPKTDVDAVWIQCGTCSRWFHTLCLGMTAAQIPSKDTPWYCVLCNT